MYAFRSVYICIYMHDVFMAVCIRIIIREFIMF